MEGSIQPQKSTGGSLPQQHPTPPSTLIGGMDLWDEPPENGSTPIGILENIGMAQFRLSTVQLVQRISFAASAVPH